MIISHKSAEKILRLSGAGSRRNEIRLQQKTDRPGKGGVTMAAEQQPINDVLTARGLANGDLVKASTEQLTFKQVQKARMGRPVTANIQGKIMRALNSCGSAQYTLDQLFKK
jgi:hypothetical protein